jgi:hypothetical protein
LLRGIKMQQRHVVVMPQQIDDGLIEAFQM